MPEATAKQDAAEVRRQELITESTRLALGIEDAENSGNAISEARLRVLYHTAQAELISLTKGASIQALEKHRALARSYQVELYRLEGGDR